MKQATINAHILVLLSCILDYLHANELRNITHPLKENERVFADESIANLGTKNSTSDNFCLMTNFSKKEYTINNEGYLQTTYSDVTFPERLYTLNNATGNATLCYPFREDFKKCYPKIWELWYREVEAINGSKTFQNKDTKELYRLGDYIPKSKGIYVCIPDSDLHYNVELERLHNIFCLTGQVLSLICLLLSKVIYLIVPMKQYDSRPLFCHMLSMAILFLTFLINELYPNSSYFPPGICNALAIINQYSFLAAFSWLNVVTLQLWQRFRKNVAFFQSLPSKELCRIFLSYNLYGWGVPTGIVVTSMAIEFFTDLPLKPNYNDMCIMNSRTGKWLFLYGPIAIMLAVNFTFFTLTIVNLNKAGQEVALANNKIHRQLMAMYIKLLFVMGISWIFDILSWAVGPRPEYWIVTDTINSLQGVFLFYIYCCKSSVMKNLKKRFPCISRTLRRPRIFKTRTSGDSITSVTSTTTESSFVADEINMEPIRDRSASAPQIRTDRV